MNKEEEEEEEEEVEVSLDSEGRILHGGTLNHSFRSFLHIIPHSFLPILAQDCSIAFTAKHSATTEQYSQGQTFWVPAAAAGGGDEELPSTSLERVAKLIFEFHTRNAKYDPHTSGAEWWPLLLDDDAEVGFHWDKDYDLEDSGVNIFPHIATVTYLGGKGAPTMILDKVAPIDTKESCLGTVERGHISKPVPGKHVSFDGRLLHSAPSDLSFLSVDKGDGSTKRAKRITFLVNVWLNHRPGDAIPFPEEFKKQMGTYSDELELNWKMEEVMNQLEAIKSKELREYEWEMKGEKKMRVHVKLPVDEMREITSSSAMIVWEKDMAGLESVKKKKKKKEEEKEKKKKKRQRGRR